MANKFLSLTNTAPIFEQVETLDGESYVLRYYWNQRAGQWFAQVEDLDGNILAAYRKICVDIPWIQRDTDEDLPPGLLWFFTRDGKGANPGLLDLGQNVQCAYIAEDNVG